MTDSNIQPPDTGAGLPDSVVPGTDVTYTTPAGLYPETTGDININTTAEGTYNVDPNAPQYDSTGDYAGAVDFQVDTMNHGGPIDDPRIDHILEHLHSLEAKIDQIACDCCQKEPPVYEGHVVLHATPPTQVNHAPPM